jgi:hypothetical protein
MPCHHALAEALRAYIDAAGIAEDRKAWQPSCCPSGSSCFPNWFLRPG